MTVNAGGAMREDENGVFIHMKSSSVCSIGMIKEILENIS